MYDDEFLLRALTRLPLVSLNPVPLHLHIQPIYISMIEFISTNHATIDDHKNTQMSHKHAVCYIHTYKYIKAI